MHFQFELMLVLLRDIAGTYLFQNQLLKKTFLRIPDLFRSNVTRALAEAEDFQM